MRRWSVLLAACLICVTMVALVAGTASGGEEEGEIRARGNCTGASEWHIAMGPEVGLSFELTIESGVADQPWHITLDYNKHELLNETEYTEDDGGFEVRIVENNAKGMDTATIHAMNLETGESCMGQLQADL